MSKKNLTIYCFVTSLIVFGILFLLFSGKSWATSYYLPDWQIWTDVPACLPGTCGALPYGDSCYNGPSQTNPGNCSNACQVFGDTWTQYTGECVNYGTCTPGYKYRSEER